MAVVNSVQDAKSRKLWIAVLAELLGTMFLVLVACGACARIKGEKTYVRQIQEGTTQATTPSKLEVTTPPAVTAKPKNVMHFDLPVDLVQISLAFGFSVGTIVWIIARVSGGHINPAVTFGFLVTRRITVVRGILYIAAQCIGALLGAGILRMVTPNNLPGHAGFDEQVGVANAFFIEMLITFVLVWTVFATCDSQRTDLNGSGPLAIGLAISMCHLWAVPYTGSGMNPARVFGIAVVSNQFKFGEHWAYWFGPLLGGALAAFLYDFVLAVNATGAKFRGYFTAGYDDSLYDQNGRKPTQTHHGDSDLPLKGRA